MIFITSVIFTVMFYMLASYVSYVASFILHRGIVHKLFAPILKSVSFIALCYISIISDIILYNDSLYKFVVIKNGFLFLLVVSSLINAKDRKEYEG